MKVSDRWEPPETDHNGCLVEIGAFLREIGLPDEYEPLDPALTDQERELRLDAKGVLAALFKGGISISQGHALEALGAGIVDAFIAANFLERREASLVPKVTCHCWHDLFIFSDPRGFSSKDVVYAYSQTTETLDGLLPLQTFDHAVDLGSGSGAISMRLADRAKRVTAIDINPRARGFTRANCIINGKTNVDAREGAMFAPLGDDDKADLIVGNLPFVLSPDQDYLYRDGDRPSEQLIGEAIAGADRLLSAGGTALYLCNWPIRDDPAAALRSWTRGHGCDVLGIEYTSDTSKEHSEHWLSDLQETDRAEYSRSLKRWGEWFASNEVSRVGFGAMALRKTNRSEPKFKFFEAAKYPSDKGGEQVSRILAAMDCEDSFDALSDVRPRLVPHELYQRMDHDGKAYVSRPAEMVSRDSAGITMSIEPETFPLILSIDGNTPFGDLAQVSPKAPETLRELALRGLIEFEA